MTEREREILDLWEELPEERRNEMIARLLDATPGWHDYAISRSYALSWLRAGFGKAAINIPEELQPRVCQRSKSQV